MAKRPQNPGRSTLIRISAAMATGKEDVLKEAFLEGARAADPTQVEEAILQSYLFLGYPAALNAFALWRKVGRGESGQGVPDDWASWSERGEGVCRTVYGGQYDGLRRNIRALHPDMERWMVVEGYGKVLGRPGLDLATRELCIAGLLAVLQAPPQLYSHLRGALNAGASQGDVEEALELACSYLDERESSAAWTVWDRVRARLPASRDNTPDGNR